MLPLIKTMSLSVGAIVGTMLKAFAAGGAGALGGFLVSEGLDNMQNNKTMQGLQNHVQNQTGVNIDGTKIEANKGLTAAEIEANKTIYNKATQRSEKQYEENLASEKAFIEKIEQMKTDALLEKIASGKNPEDEQKEQKEKEPLRGTEGETPSEEPEIKDQSGLNLESQINWLDQIEEWRNEQWAREDAIRAETQAREDNAYQRATSDAIKAGINPNLMNIQPASAGGGITNATGVDTSALTNQMQIDLDEMQQIIDNAFKEDENSKDRFMQVFANIIQMIAIKLILKM